MMHQRKQLGAKHAEWCDKVDDLEKALIHLGYLKIDAQVESLGR